MNVSKIINVMLPGENLTQFILSFVILLLNTSELDSPSILNITKLQKTNILKLSHKGKYVPINYEYH